MFLPSNITLKSGDTGDFVSELQRRLAAQGFLSEGNVSGLFDGATTSGVSHFQGANGLFADGIAGPKTIHVLNGGSPTADGGDEGNKQDEEEQAQEAHVHLGAGEEVEISDDRLIDYDALPKNPKASEPAEPRLPKPDETGKAALGAGKDKFVWDEDDLGEALAREAREQARAPAAPPNPFAKGAEALQDERAAFQGVAAAPPNPFANREPQEASVQGNPTAAAAPPNPFAKGAAEKAPGVENPAAGQAPEGKPMQVAVEKVPAASVIDPNAYRNPRLNEIRSQIEARLSPQARMEAHQVGVAMLKLGVKESAVPSDMAELDISRTPARGPSHDVAMQVG